ncbi:oxidoreductase protein [Rutstroemia sp. NJR-2017a BBW]|nr:oxidoreductase protein [Rutstroemia sp. NJR-2017a BBW]
MSSSNSKEGHASKPGKGAPGLSEIATRAAIEHLRSVLPKSNYCCGGSIPLSTDSPVTIRFDSSSTSSIHKIQFPSSPSSPSGIKELLLASERATFGLDGKDVLDETYRKAAALNPNKFSTNFHPADHGLLDALGQVLLPDYGLRLREKKKDLWGVKAELYKLNVYSGPSGKFEKHVDTPRGALQFGSLVVCLPYEHQGLCLSLSLSLVLCTVSFLLLEIE